mmetsp:Transcript_23111/g.37110  ORF Transcript_23111/g.37110 Transcript_23111/m.37110 type:complete len:401 (-) Transcript_23111:27-1229(-)
MLGMPSQDGPEAPLHARSAFRGRHLHVYTLAIAGIILVSLSAYPRVVSKRDGVRGTMIDLEATPTTATSWPPFPPHPTFPPQPSVEASSIGAASESSTAAVAAKLPVAAPYAGIVTYCHGPKFKDMGKWATLNHREYAKQHGYDSLQGDEHTLPHMHFLTPLAWLKAGLFWQLLQSRSEHQWFVWADCDALYMNLKKSVPDLLRDLRIDPSPAGATHMVIAKDIGDGIFNTGVLLVKNSEWSRDFFANVLRMGKHMNVRNHGHWEQFAMQQLYKGNKHEEQARVAIVQERYKLNAFTIESEYIDGTSFVLHQVNCPGHPANKASSWKQCGDNMKLRFCEKLAKKYPRECATSSPASPSPSPASSHRRHPQHHHHQYRYSQWHHHRHQALNRRPLFPNPKP